MTVAHPLSASWRRQQRQRLRGPKGLGSVWYSDTDHCWRGKIPLPNGKTKRFSGKSEAAVVAKMKRFVPLSPGGDITITDMLDRWFETLQGKVEAKELTQDTVEWKRDVLARVYDELGAIRCSELLASDVAWLLGVAARAGLARQSIKHLRNQFALALDWALARDLVKANVARVTDMPTGIRPSKQKRESMTREQARALLAAVKTERLEALFVTAILLGLRPGELLGLRWHDVDFERRKIGINHSLKRDGTFGSLKNEDSAGVLDMPALVVEALRAHKARQATEQLAAKRWTDTDAVFATRVGTPTDDSNLRRMTKRICHRAGLGKWTPHEFRHTAGSLLLDAEVPRENVRRVLRHKNMRMIDETYGHEVRPSVDAAVEPMEQIFGSGS